MRGGGRSSAGRPCLPTFFLRKIMGITSQVSAIVDKSLLVSLTNREIPLQKIINMKRKRYEKSAYEKSRTFRRRRRKGAEERNLIIVLVFVSFPREVCKSRRNLSMQNDYVLLVFTCKNRLEYNQERALQRLAYLTAYPPCVKKTCVDRCCPQRWPLSWPLSWVRRLLQCRLCIADSTADWKAGLIAIAGSELSSCQ